MLDKDQEGQSGGADGDPIVAVPAVVASNFELSCRPARILEPSKDLLLDATGISHPLLVRGSLLLAAWTFRRRYENRGLPEGVVQLLLASNREATSATYKSAWNVWFHWCAKRSENPLSSFLNLVLDFLSGLFHEGKAY